MWDKRSYQVMFARRRNGGGWSSWASVAETSEPVSKAEADHLFEVYVSQVASDTVRLKEVQVS